MQTPDNAKFVTLLSAAASKEVISGIAHMDHIHHGIPEPISITQIGHVESDMPSAWRMWELEFTDANAATDFNIHWLRYYGLDRTVPGRLVMEVLDANIQG